MIFKRLVPLSVVLCFVVCSIQMAHANTPLRVLTWNIQFGQGTDGATNFNRTATQIAKMNPDIVAVCEMPPDSISTLVGYLTQKTGRTWYTQFAPKFPGSPEGNLIMSSYSFVSVSSKFLSANRSVAQATINVGGKNINFFATHLDDAASANRLTEANELVNWAAGFSAPRIVVGDLNAGNDTPEIIRLLGNYRDSWIDAVNAGSALAYPDNPVWANTRTRRWRIDYILYSADLSTFSVRDSNIPDTRDLSNTNVVEFLGTTDDKGVRPSDHNMVVTDFDIASGTVAPPPPPPTIPALLTQGSTNRAIAIHSTLFVGEPFTVQTGINFSSDHRTRIMLFATNLDFLAGETISSVTIRATDSRSFSYDLPVEDVLKVPNNTWLSALIVRLPDDQTISGDLSINLGMRGGTSNTVRVAIKAAQ
jgi:endonuclease/exonuclease/phosphatase family metal-dependent hydrolase